ncbi:hypothetical protein [Hymenobacter weizhouensis]|uniref:hypothetical protein n=1 Tax=Hymenobacter sp. YIM 151500-1 TaxID=2987689 RepID=UPI0022269002|nr:hypothetical protein [Hymenobacter sp. YIM 151500-1]UYZ64369.1 hypothetical protein OIS53_05835 [Hymenobacter sp. YIM 151500-1]
MLRRFLLLLLPLLFLLLSGAGLGAYLETNDDLTIVGLLRGTSAAAPVTDLHLYFHGYAAVWAALYRSAPMVPWYALTLYGLLYAATVLGGAVLEKLLRGRLPGAGLVAFLGLFFGVAWLEHGFWFSYVRVPVLLAGAGVLFAAQRTPARWALVLGLLAFGLAWLVRPSAAVLGAVVAAPGAWWLAGRRAGPVLGGAAAWSLLGALCLHLTWSPEAATFRRLDVLKSNLLDFQLTAPPAQPLTAQDSLALAAAHRWMLADSTLVNEAFFRRATPIRPAYFLAHTAPGKLTATVTQLARDYFPLLLLLLATWVLAARQRSTERGFWLVQLAYVGLTLGVGTVLKLPPRLALPLLDLWVLGNVVYVFQLPALEPTRAARVLLAVLAVAAVPYAYKTAHRRVVLAQEQQRNRTERQRLQHVAGRSALLVSDAWEPTFKAESPFNDGPAPPLATYTLPVLDLQRLAVAGWHTLHPSQAALRQQLTGTRDFTEALRRLGGRPGVAWVLTPEAAAILNRQLALRPASGQPLRVLVPVQPDSGRAERAQLYQMRTKFPH